MVENPAVARVRGVFFVSFDFLIPFKTMIVAGTHGLPWEGQLDTAPLRRNGRSSQPFPSPSMSDRLTMCSMDWPTTLGRKHGRQPRRAPRFSTKRSAEHCSLWLGNGQAFLGYLPGYSKDHSGPGFTTFHISWNAKKAPHARVVKYGHIPRYAASVVPVATHTQTRAGDFPPQCRLRRDLHSACSCLFRPCLKNCIASTLGE